MSITQILKTLSDTELIAISREVNNPEIPNRVILEQIYNKSNYIFNKEDMFDELVNSLSEKLCLELSERLLQSNQI